MLGRTLERYPNDSESHYYLGVALAALEAGREGKKKKFPDDSTGRWALQRGAIGAGAIIREEA